jgi:hypothetical protein
MTVLLTFTNLFSVAKYGEFEFWFAMLKVIAIVAFIALARLPWRGLARREVSGLTRLMAEHGGFMPNGWTAVVGALLTTMFSFLGTEAVTIAASESTDPARNIAKATRSVIWRISVFYLLSIFVIISVVPWNDPLLPVGARTSGRWNHEHPQRQAAGRHGGAGGGGQLPELVDLHRLAHAVLAGQARRCTGGHWPPQGRGAACGGDRQHADRHAHHRGQLLRAPRCSSSCWPAGAIACWCTW